MEETFGAKVKQKTPIFLWMLMIGGVAMMLFGPLQMKLPAGGVGLASLGLLLVASGRKKEGFSILGIIWKGSSSKKIDVTLSTQYKTTVELMKPPQEFKHSGEGCLEARWPGGSITCVPCDGQKKSKRKENQS